MKFKKILSNSQLFEKLWKLYHSSFPSAEKKSKKQVVASLKKNQFYFYAIYDKELIGFISLWKFKEFSFIEYFAIYSKFRNKGYGKKIIKQLLKRNFVLEIEPPIDKITKRRINFYKTLGFHLNTYNYIQPALAKNKQPFHGKIMSYPKKLNTIEYKKIKDTLYRVVYNENIRPG